MKKKAFISYSHRDNTENFVGRLTYALDMYIDTFWDHKLQAGPWSNQLIQALEECEYLLVVMSQIQKNDSEWCRIELEKAAELGKIIIPIRRFANHADPDLEQLQLADFTTSFDTGFRKLTSYLLGEEKTSWEYLFHEPDRVILEALRQGQLPGIIAQSIIEFLIVDNLWKVFAETYTSTTIRPRTASDVLYALGYVREKAIESGEISQVNPVDDLKTIVGQTLKQSASFSELQHQETGALAFQFMNTTRDLLEAELIKHGNIYGVQSHRETFQFNVATRIKELITHYSRQSRYLY